MSLVPILGIPVAESCIGGAKNGAKKKEEKPSPGGEARRQRGKEARRQGGKEARRQGGKEARRHVTGKETREWRHGMIWHEVLWYDMV